MINEEAKTENLTNLNSISQNCSSYKTIEDINTERIDDWKVRKTKSASSFYLKQNTSKDDVGNTIVKLTREPSGNEPLTQEQYASTLCAAYGSANYEYAVRLLMQTTSGFIKNANEDINTHVADASNAITGALLSLAPKDEIEGMLCTRLLVLHDQYMTYMTRAALPGQNHACVDLNINRATKLMRLYNETLDTLNRHRRKGEQKVTVQHVNVREGGQAIINGQLNQEGVGECEKDKGAAHAN